MDTKFVILLALACSAAWGPGMAATITNAKPEELAAAIEAGGSIRLAFDGTVSLEKALLIVTNTTVDASDHRVTLDGGNLTRHFTVTNGATLRLRNLTLANGRQVGETHVPGRAGLGGSIYNSGGKLELLACNFLRNQVKGGMRVPGMPSLGVGTHMAARSVRSAVRCGPPIARLPKISAWGAPRMPGLANRPVDGGMDMEEHSIAQTGGWSWRT